MLTPKIMKEEKPECNRKSKKDGTITTLSSMENLLKKNKDTEIIIKLIWKNSLKMKALNKRLMNLKSYHLKLTD